MVVIDSQMQVTPKGVQEPINVYKIAGITGQYNLFLSQKNGQNNKHLNRFIKKYIFIILNCIVEK